MAERNGSGWGSFAAVVFTIAGVSNAIEGLGALYKKEYYNEAGLLYSNLKFWAWAWMIVGVLQIMAAYMLVGRAKAGRTLGIVLAAGAAVVAILSVGVQPEWPLASLAMNLLIVYGLTAHPEGYGVVSSSGPGPLGAQTNFMSPPPPR